MWNKNPRLTRSLTLIRLQRQAKISFPIRIYNYHRNRKTNWIKYMLEKCFNLFHRHIVWIKLANKNEMSFIDQRNVRRSGTSKPKTENKTGPTIARQKILAQNLMPTEYCWFHSHLWTFYYYYFVSFYFSFFFASKVISILVLIFHLKTRTKQNGKIHGTLAQSTSTCRNVQNKVIANIVNAKQTHKNAHAITTTTENTTKQNKKIWKTINKRKISLFIRFITAVFIHSAGIDVYDVNGPGP